MFLRAFFEAGPLHRCLLVLVAVLSAAAQPASGQDGLGEQAAISGNLATITVTIRPNTGGLLTVSAVVKLYKSTGTPAGQASTSSGRVIFTPRSVGDFTVIVDAPGYQQGRVSVNVPVPMPTEVDVYMRPEGDTKQNNTTAPGKMILAPKAKEALDKGLAALREENLAEADKYLKKAVALAPQHPDILYLEGVLYLRTEQWSNAQAVLEKASQIDPSHARAQAALGTALANQGKFSDAIPPLEKSLQLGASGWETHWTLARAYYYHKQFPDALKLSQQALKESNGKAPEIEILVAQALSATGRYEDCAKALREFLKNHNDHPEAATARRYLARLAKAQKIQPE
jgi:thioredoxin-like negative regulator of GroEL